MRVCGSKAIEINSDFAWLRNPISSGGLWRPGSEAQHSLVASLQAADLL